MLREEDPSAFRLDADGLSGGGMRDLDRGAGALPGARFACSFGSCSFAEPVADLRALGVIA